MLLAMWLLEEENVMDCERLVKGLGPMEQKYEGRFFLWSRLRGEGSW